MTTLHRVFAHKAAALVAVLALLGAACTGPPGSPNYFSYRSTTVQPPTWSIVAGPGATADGLTFTGTQTNALGIARGFNIHDSSGEPVWSMPGSAGYAVFADLKVIDWGGQPALGMYEGLLFTGQQGVSEGRVRILDSSYDEIGVFEPQYDPLADLHDFIVVGTSMYFIIYDPVTMDLTPHGGSANATVFDAVIQEIDVDTNQVLWEWHSLDHIPVTDTELDLTTLTTVDYLHVNSLELDGSGDVLFSARNADAAYMIDKATGEVLWQLGGSNSDFTFTNDGGFLRQHDARFLPDGTIGLFDNGQTGVREWSRGVRYDLDFGAMEATMVQELRHSPDIFGFAMGNVDWLPNGNALVGWGTAAGFTEFDSAGDVVLDAEYPGFSSYRTVRSDWVGTPSAPPDVAILAGTLGFQDFYMSWNGSTETAQWRIEGGDPGNMSELTTVQRDGFETKIPILTDLCDFAVTPLDDIGNPLASPVEVASTVGTCAA